MKVSIITAARNAVDTIEETILSVASQDYADIEYIVIDGNSTDGTQGVVRRHATIVSSFVSERDSGIYDALNKGVRSATGDVIGILHADDVLAEPTIISKVVHAIRAQESDLLYGNLCYVRRAQVNTVIRRWNAGVFRQGSLRWGWMPPHPTLFVRRHIYARFGHFNQEYKIAADYDFMLRVLMDRSVRWTYLPDTLVLMKAGGVSNGTLRGVIRKSVEDLRAIRGNGVGGIATLVAKNLRKVHQFL